MTFWGEERFPEEAGHHPHDAPPVMAWPLRMLAVCALFIGVAGRADALGLADYLHHTLGLAAVRRARTCTVGLMVAERRRSSLAGIGLAWLMYVQLAASCRRRSRRRFGPLYTAVAQQVLLRRDFLGDPRRAAARSGVALELVRSQRDRSDRRWRGAGAAVAERRAAAAAQRAGAVVCAGDVGWGCWCACCLRCGCCLYLR